MGRPMGEHVSRLAGVLVPREPLAARPLKGHMLSHWLSPRPLETGPLLCTKPELSPHRSLESPARPARRGRHDTPRWVALPST